MAQKRCCFAVVKLPKKFDYVLRGTFDEKTCCGKAATCSVYAEGKTFPLCAEHYDAVWNTTRQDEFADYKGWELGGAKIDPDCGG